MKSFILLVILTISPFILKGQDFQLKFVGAGAARKVDSVIVLNLARCSTIKLDGKDILNLSVADNSKPRSGKLKAMPYIVGDRLKLTGYSKGMYSTIIVLVPVKSQTVTFKFNSCTDFDGNHYQVVQIGDQLWMAENLKTTRYRNGDPVPEIADSVSWKNFSQGAHCTYNNYSGNTAIYGKLYNWYAVNDSRKLAPEGWHIPTIKEWETLSEYLGGNARAGAKLKSKCSTLWTSPNKEAGNESGFTALPGGFRDVKAAFIETGNWGVWWYSTEIDPGTANIVVLWFNDIAFGQHFADKTAGISVRCIKD